MLEAEPSDSELAQMAKEEVGGLEAEEKRLALEVQRGILPPDPADSRNTIVEIRAGAGGQESALFSADLTGCIRVTPKVEAGRSKILTPALPIWAATRK